MQYPESATIVNSSSKADSNCPESSEESFVTDDDGNSNASHEEDDEYFIFVGRGDHEDNDDQAESSTMETTFPDPYDRVYQNILDSTHQLEPRPDCNHCGYWHAIDTELCMQLSHLSLFMVTFGKYVNMALDTTHIA
ncbi:hypothetical protein EJB05_50483, partial [Eragrostis curvula]